MQVTELHAQNWRNIGEATIYPDRELTVLCGDNGQGKTNLLEAVWALTGAKSFRSAKDAELVRSGEEFSVLEAELVCRGQSQQLRLTNGLPGSERQGRYISQNGLPPVRAAALAGVFTAVVFDPNHLSLVKGGPEGRRHFMDTALCQLYPAYVSLLKRYSRIVVQKNAFLKDCRGLFSLSRSQSELIDVYNHQLSEIGEEVSRRRREYLQALSPMAVANYDEISSGREKLELRYQCSFGEAGLFEEANKRKSEEIRAGFCLVGPHREDFEVILNEKSARSYGSQGQQRSAVLSLKLAEAGVAAEVTGDSPVMLLDDVLSELDESRRSWLLTRMTGRQTIVTACDSEEFLKTGGILYRVQNGSVSKI